MGSRGFVISLVMLSFLGCGHGDGGGGIGKSTAVKNKFCSDLAAVSSSCSNAIDKNGCLSRVKAFSDDDVGEGADCLNSGSCEEGAACFNEAFPLGGGSKPDPKGAMCSTQPGADQCDQCLAANCCGQYASCQGDADCAELFACVSQCTTQACGSACLANSGTAGKTKFNTWFACAQKDCSAECQ